MNFLKFLTLLIFNFVLQIDESKRPKFVDRRGQKSDEILKVLESLEEKIQNDSNIKADWESFHEHLIKCSAVFEVDEKSLISRDLYKEITKLNLNAKSGQIATGGTKLYDQQDTNLCACFAALSALRHQLRKVVGSNKASYGEDIKEYLKRHDEDEQRFERDLSVMVGCVSPRSLSARFKIIHFKKKQHRKYLLNK